jgi:hypothetical protein
MVEVEEFVNKKDDPNYYKNYYQKNKKKLTKPVFCDCGLKITASNMSKHKKTEVHSLNLTINSLNLKIISLKAKIKAIKKKLEE